MVSNDAIILLLPLFGYVGSFFVSPRPWHQELGLRGSPPTTWTTSLPSKVALCGAAEAIFLELEVSTH